MKTLVCIVGPTGVGKTALAIDLAQKFNGELVSADSRQVYIGMDIATGKEVADGEWQQLRGRKALTINGIPIFGLDLALPNQQFSVHDWLKAVDPVIKEIIDSGKTPIVVGGTGFYVSALQGGIETVQYKPNQDLRNQLVNMTISELQQKLQQIDELKWQNLNSSDRINPRRLVRAIELAHNVASGQAKADNPMQIDSYPLKLIGLTMSRGALYNKIDARIDKMFEQGLVKETKELLKTYNRQIPSMTGIGYAEAVQYINHEISLDQAIQKVKWRNHSYVRRQYTWFRKQEVEWIDVEKAGWQSRVNKIIEEIIPINT